MERAQANPVGSPAFEADEIAHHVNDVGGVEDLLYCIVVNHIQFCVIGRKLLTVLYHGVGNERLVDT